MFDFDTTEKEIEEELATKLVHMKADARRQKAITQGTTLARDAVQAKIDEVKMTMSLLDAQTREFSYAKVVLDQLTSIQAQMPCESPYGGLAIGTGILTSTSRPNGAVLC